MRTAAIKRKTRETEIAITLNVDGGGSFEIDTSIGFFNHMIESFAKHGLFDVAVKAKGDLEVDQHHLVEDCGIVLGQVFNKALGNKKGINRAGFFVYPMDEALAVVAVDLGGRSYLQFDADFKRRFCGDFDTDLLEDFFSGFSMNLEANVVVRMPFGRSDHHKIESIFKAFGKSMKMACAMDPRMSKNEDILSTKGVIKNDSYY